MIKHTSQLIKLHPTPSTHTLYWINTAQSRTPGTFCTDFTRISHPENAAHAHPISTHTHTQPWLLDALGGVRLACGRCSMLISSDRSPNSRHSNHLHRNSFGASLPPTNRHVMRWKRCLRPTRQETHTSQAKQLCANMGRTPPEVASDRILSFPKGLDSTDFDVFGMLADYGALCNVTALTSFVFNDKKEQAMLSLSKALASKGISQLEMLFLFLLWRWIVVSLVRDQQRLPSKAEGAAFFRH